MNDLPSELQTHGGRTLRLTLVNLNPPHFQLLLLPLALVPAGVALSLWAVAVANLQCLGGSIYVIARELELRPSRPNCYRAAVWLLAFAGLGAVLETGEMSLLLSLPLTLAWAAASACFVAGALIFGPGSYWSWLSQLSSVSWAWRSANASVLGILTRSLSENPTSPPSPWLRSLSSPSGCPLSRSSACSFSWP